MKKRQKGKIMKKNKLISKVKKLSKKTVCVLATVLMCTNSLYSQGSFVYAAGTDTGSAENIAKNSEAGNLWKVENHYYSSYDDSKNKALEVDNAYGYKLKSKEDKNGNSLKCVEVLSGSTRVECNPPSDFHDKEVTLPSFLKDYTWFHVTSESDVFKVKITGLSIWQNGKFVDVDMVRTISNPKIDDAYGDGYVAIGAGIANVSYIGLDQMTVKTQFYKAGTSTAITLKSNLTLNDIDECQYVSINADKVTGEYVSANTKLKYMEKGGNAYYCSDSPNYEGEAFTAVGFTFESSSFTYTFGRDMGQHPDYTHATRTEQYVGSGQSMVDFPTEPPVKTVTNDSNDKETDVEEIHVRDLSKTWTYSVSQPIPAKAENFYYDTFAFEDNIEACMKVLDVKVIATNGDVEKDVSSMFNISTTGNKVTAALKNPKDSEFYSNVLYTMKVKVKMNVPENLTEEQLTALKETWTEHGHYTESKTQIVENNTAKTVIDGENKTTNEVKTYIHLSTNDEGGNDPGLKITKDVNRYENEVGDVMKYTVKVSNTNKDADTAYFIIKDTSLPDSFALDFSSVKVSGIDEKNYTLTQSGNGWVLKSNGDYALPYGTTITITYEAKALVASNGTCVDNTASAVAAGIPEKSDKEQVYINSPKVDVVKTTPDTKHKVGDTVGYKVEITNRNPGTFMRDIVLNDLVKTEGLEIKEGTVAVLVGGKDVTNAMEISYDEDGKGFAIQTPFNLKNGTIPCIGIAPYSSIANWTDKIVATYDATITDEAAEESDLENVFTAPATKNTNGDVIKDDPEIPSGGGEDTEDVTMKAPALSITKKSNKQEYKVGETGTYTLEVKQTKENLTAKNVVITDTFAAEDGIKVDASSITVMFNGEDITKDCKITAEDRNFSIQTGKDETDEDKITVTYKVTFTKTGEYTNTAVAKSDNTKEDQANNVVEVKEATPDMGIEKASDKNEYTEGETGKYTLKITQKNADATAKNVIVKDYFKQADGLEIQKDTLKVVLNGEDITKDCKTAVNTNDFYIETGKDMTSKDTMTVTYDVLFTKTGTYENKAATLAENAGEKQDDNTVKVVKSDVNMTKDADKKTYKESENVNYTVSVALKKEGAKAKNVVIKDEVPKELELLKDSVKVQGVKGYAAEVKDNTLTVKIPEMSYGEKATVTYQATVLKTALGKKLTNKATVNGDGINGGNAEVTVEVPKPETPKKSTTTTPGSTTSTPKTGDAGNMVPYAAAIAAAGIAAIVVLRKKKKLKKSYIIVKNLCADVLYTTKNKKTKTHKK